MNIILYKTGTISAADKAALKSSGYLPVACSEPESVSMLFPDGQKLKGDDIFQAAIQSISGPNSAGERDKFAKSVIASVTNPSA